MGSATAMIGRVLAKSRKAAPGGRMGTSVAPGALPRGTAKPGPAVGVEPARINRRT